MWDFLYQFFVEPRSAEPGVVFAGTHLWYLIGSLVLFIVLTALMKNKPVETRHKFINVLFTISITLEVLKRIRFFLVGLYFGTPLFENVMFLIPYHICYITVILMPFVYYFNIKWAKEFVYTMAMIGALIAVLYPYDWFNEPFIRYEIVHEMIYHLPLFFIPFFLIVTGEFKPNYKKVWQVALGTVLFLPLAELGNTIFDNPSYNFMFTRVNPLPIDFFPGVHHLATFIVLFAIVMVIYYGLVELFKLRSKKKQPA